jgi:hypothetical protein
MRVVAEKLKQAAYTAHVLNRIASSGISVRAQALDLAEVARRLGVAELNLLGERTSKTDLQFGSQSGAEVADVVDCSRDAIAG